MREGLGGLAEIEDDEDRGHRGQDDRLVGVNDLEVRHHDEQRHHERGEGDGEHQQQAAEDALAETGAEHLEAIAGKR